MTYHGYEVAHRRIPGKRKQAKQQWIAVHPDGKRAHIIRYCRRELFKAIRQANAWWIVGSAMAEGKK